MPAHTNQRSDEPIDPGNQHRLISASDVRTMFGKVSDMTIWRWLKDPALNFPRPIYVQRRRFWRETEVLEWIENQPRELTASVEALE